MFPKIGVPFWGYIGFYRVIQGLGFPKITGYFFGGPYGKDYSILGSILGSPYFGKLSHEL